MSSSRLQGIFKSAECVRLEPTGAGAGRPCFVAHLMSQRAGTVRCDNAVGIGLKGGQMDRREFLAQLAAGMATAGYLFLGNARAESVNIGVVPVGKRGRVLADELVGGLPGALAHVDVIDASTARESPRELDGVVIFGCLGGRTGLDDAAACGRIVRQSCGAVTAVLLWPMDFEGSRRHASAHLAAGRIRAHGARTLPVMVDLPAELTLGEARERRERALLASGLQEIQRWCR